MFGSSNLSGQSSSSNPLAPKPFSTSTGLFRAPQVSSPFGASSQGFVSSTPVFRPSAFGSSDSPCGRTPAFGFSTPQPSPSVSTTQKNTFGAFNTSTSTPSFSFGSSSAFGQSNSPFGSTQSPFGCQQVGSRVKTYALTVEAEQDGGTKSAIKLGSLSAMPVYKHKSHEELRWEDYQRGDKGGQSPFFAATSPNPTNNFSSTTATTLFAPTTTSKSSSPFGPTTTNVFGPSPSFTVTPSRSFFASSTIASAPANASTQAFSSGFSFNNSHSSALFSSNPSMRQTRSAFEQNTTPTYNFTTPSTGSKNLFSSTSSLTTSTSFFVQTTPANLTPNQSAQPAQPSDAYGQVPASFNSVVTQIAPVTNPFGTLPALPQFPIQYGISSMPAPARISPLLTSRNLLQRRVRPSVRKCRPGDDDAPKATFFSDTLKSSAPFIPRENPRALFIQDWRRR